MISHLKQAVKASGKSLRAVAELTGVSESTVSRYLSGEQSPPFDFVAKLAESLGLSLDEITGNPTGAKRAEENAMLDALHASFEKRLEDKRDHIASLKARIERMESAHAAEIERLEKRHSEDLDKAEKLSQEYLKRIDHKNWIIAGLVALMVLVCLFAMYWILDALNGDWGKIRYELYAMPDLWNAAVDKIVDWFAL